MLPGDGAGGGLFLGPIPEPSGDPAALSKGAATYTAAHGEIVRNRAALVSAAGQADGMAWQGAGAAGYVAATTDLAAACVPMAAALARGATALRAYAADLTVAKETARQANAAVATSNAAATALLGAEATARQCRATADEATQTAAAAETQAAANPHSPAAALAAHTARSAANNAQSSADSAWGQVSSLSRRYDADHSRALALITQAQTQAAKAARKAAAAFDAAAAGLMEKARRPARGGAVGVPGGGLGQTIFGVLSSEFGKIPLDLSGFLFAHYGLGLPKPIWLPEADAPWPTVKAPSLFGPDGGVLLSREIPVLERQFSLQTLRGFRMDPVNVPGWADLASKGLFAAGGGISIFGAADSQWQQDAMEHPHMSTLGRISSAALTGAAVGGGETYGTWQGAEMGAETGAAVCSEAGPVAVACGAVGALAGGFGGSKIGGTLGSTAESLAKGAWHGIKDGASWLASQL